MEDGKVVGPHDNEDQTIEEAFELANGEQAYFLTQVTFYIIESLIYLCCYTDRQRTQNIHHGCNGRRV